MKFNRLLFWSVVVSLAGFLFGFDTVVISGADKQLQELWGSSDLFHGMVVMSMALWGTVLGALFGAYPTNRFGRKKTLLFIGILFLFSALGTAFAHDPYTFALFRFTGGIGIGISTICAPAYISEIAPADKRGRLVAMYQFNVVFGILLAYVSNYLLRGLGEDAWRWMLGVQAFPALVFFLLMFKVPESPRWLLEYRNDKEGALHVLAQVSGNEDAKKEINNVLAEKKQERARETIFSPQYRTALFLAFFMAFFNQFSGINAFLYYAPRIFEIAGLEKSASFFSSIGIGITNMIFTLVGISLIDKFGRRTLMYIGSVGYIISLGLVSIFFIMNWNGKFIPFFFFLFIAAHAIGQGSVIWVFISEIFPNKLRAAGQAFGSSVHWILAALIPSFIPFLFKTIGEDVVFCVFTVMMVFQLIWVRFFMPETKGRSLEDISQFINDNQSGEK